VHIYILGPKLLQWNFLQSLSYLYEVVRTNCLNYVPHAQADQAWHTKNTNFHSYSRRA